MPGLVPRTCRNSSAGPRRRARKGTHPTRADFPALAATASRRCPKGGTHPTRADFLALAKAASRLGPEAIAAATLYTSAEPCVMCTGAARWTGIRRIVHALSEHRLLELTGLNPENPTSDLPCPAASRPAPREVLSRGQRHIGVVGPLLEEEAAAPHLGFWNYTACTAGAKA